MASRDERLAKNEVLFREVNERIRDVTEFPGETDFICECGDAECVEPVALSLAEYEAVRATASRFFVRTGHELPDIEDVVERTDRYTIVAKRNGVPGRVAAESDPRS